MFFGNIICIPNESWQETPFADRVSFRFIFEEIWGVPEFWDKKIFSGLDNLTTRFVWQIPVLTRTYGIKLTAREKSTLNQKGFYYSHYKYLILWPFSVSLGNFLLFDSGSWNISVTNTSLSFRCKQPSFLKEAKKYF